MANLGKPGAIAILFLFMRYFFAVYGTFNTNEQPLSDKEQKISDFMQMYQPVQRQLSAYCRVLAGNEDAAFDLLQDTLLAALEGFETARQANSFIYYLCGIARNIHLKHTRRWKFWGNNTEAAKRTLEISHDSIELQPDVELLYKAIAKLNDEQREVLLMFHIMGFSVGDIQQHLQITEAAVKNRLQRARAKLKQLLSDSESSIQKAVSVNLSNTQQP
jgi:RNA polymerase sigma-70 factor (ECF subfamily)